MMILRELWKNANDQEQKIKYNIMVFDFSITSIILVIMAFYKNVIHDNFILGYKFCCIFNYIYIFNEFFLNN